MLKPELDSFARRACIRPIMFGVERYCEVDDAGDANRWLKPSGSELENRLRVDHQPGLDSCTACGDPGEVDCEGGSGAEERSGRLESALVWLLSGQKRGHTVHEATETTGLSGRPVKGLKRLQNGGEAAIRSRLIAGSNLNSDGIQSDRSLAPSSVFERPVFWIEVNFEYTEGQLAKPRSIFWRSKGFGAKQEQKRINYTSGIAAACGVRKQTELPFTVWYSLPGYEFEGLELLRFENGMIDTKKPFESATWMLETNVRDHKLPLIGPANAKRIMFKFLLIGEPEPESTNTLEPTPLPTRSVSPPPKEVLTPGATYLLDKYGHAMRSVDSDVGTGKSNVKGGRPIGVLVEWVTNIEDIMLESKAQEAAEAIRNQRERLAHNRTKLQKFNKYLANNDPKKAMGVKSFAEAVQAFREAEESRDSDDDI
ncbi:hypothetical protein B0H14DRAFT_3134680 [Mycena olivaceomarginata]|nr:hypothetical protein B0H14DRAFT_3134680 [Mycena olivaceomarginata]